MNFKKLVTLGAALLTITMMSTTGFANHHRTAQPAASTSRIATTYNCNVETCLVNGICNGTCTGTGACLGFAGCNSVCTGSNTCITNGACSGHRTSGSGYSGHYYGNHH